MPMRVSCPACGEHLSVPPESAGTSISCPKCTVKMLLPNPEAKQIPRAEVMADERDEEDPESSDSLRSSSRRNRKREIEDEDEPVRKKYCHECGERIRSNAEICPACGVRQPARRSSRRKNTSIDGIKVPLLVSAISNIFHALIWSLTCYGLVLTVPMIVLCIFEFMLWSKADRLTPRKLASDGKNLAIFQIVLGLCNWVTLVCGILLLINSGKLIEELED